MNDNDKQPPPIELQLVVHRDHPRDNAVLMSETGDGDKAFWIPRSLISKYERTDKLVDATDHGRTSEAFIINVEIPEWFAKKQGLI